ncbi:MAG: LexA repressor [Gammaproteobacteria bacterium]|nr:MAG: LexA repressor [Gammaproteobacteria bacterium]
MTEALTERQAEVLSVIRDYVQVNGIAPTHAELAKGIGVSSTRAAADHLKALERKGHIHLHSDKPRGIQLLTEAFYELPLIGSVAAGTPITAVENLERHIPVPDGLFSSRPTYLLRVRGDSMKDAGILDGDMIAVQKTERARHGQIVIARIDDEVTVKYLDSQSPRPVLLPANQDYNPITFEPDELSIEGVFVGLIRDA